MRKCLGARCIAVDDPDDPRLSDYVGLSDPQLRRRVEAERGFFIAESPLVVQALVRSGRAVRSVLVTPAQHDALADVARRRSTRRCTSPAPDVLRRGRGLRSAPGRGRVGRSLAAPDRRIAARRRRGGSRCCEKLGDHENLGGIFRNAAAFGIDAVLLDAECADPLYRRCVRVSIGHVLTVPWTRLDSLDELRRAGFALFALTPAPGAEPLDAVDWPRALRAAARLGGPGPVAPSGSRPPTPGPHPDATRRRLAQRRDRGRDRVLRELA